MKIIMGDLGRDDSIGFAKGSSDAKARRTLERFGVLSIRNREAGLRAWLTFPVEALDRKNRAVTGYAGLAITGRCEPVTVNEDEFEYLKSPGGWFAHSKGLRVATAWRDGSDIFVGADAKTGFVVETR
ncbi:MAG: hypothetical protein JNM66_07270 [Bryobacterales bacterium]|nr:hypothetical protein [Bryobacterales bacterium]